MRINKFIAQATGLSRRAADQAIADGRVTRNSRPAAMGDVVAYADVVQLDGQVLQLPATAQTIILNKPRGYICSRNGQGSQTIYDLLPKHLHQLKPVGRLDKDSSGLLVLTDDGQLANQLAHPSSAKQKVYEITLDKPLTDHARAAIASGVPVEDYTSHLQLSISGNNTSETSGRNWCVTMAQGRNRQIRRTFEALGYTVTRLHRTAFGPFSLGQLGIGETQEVTP